MELIHTYQAKSEELQSEHFDVFLAGCGYQSKCNFFLKSLQNLPDKKIILVHNENNKLFFRRQQLDAFKDLNCDIVNLKTDQTDIIHQYIRQCVQNNDNQTLKMLVDYSCMPFNWYYQLINTILQSDPYLSKVEIYFAYVPAFIDNQPQKQKIQQFVHTKPQNYQGTLKPKALILDLGLSPGITNEIINHFKPEEIIFFVANESFYKEKAETILNNHFDLLKNADENKVISYQVDRLEETIHKISSQCLNLRLDYDVTVVSNGFKPFKLATLLVQQQYTDISLCDIQLFTDRRNTGERIHKPVICKTIFLPDDVIDEMDDDDINDVLPGITIEKRLLNNR
jgi:hypothetical protein